MHTMNTIYLSAVFSLVILYVDSVRVCTKLSLLDGNVRVNDGGSSTSLPTDNSSQSQNEPSFTTLENSSLMQCARQCKLRSRCQSFNFRLTKGQCELFSTVMVNTSTTNISTSGDDVYADNIHSWPSRLAGDCENHTCPPHTVCEGNMFCLVTHCVNPPVIPNGAVELDSSTRTFFDIGKVKFTCEAVHRHQDNLICLSNGSWSVPSCIPITECNHVKLCNSSYGDGEYWIQLRDKNYTRVKIYCEGMDSTSPIHFITLVEENYSESPGTCPLRCGRTTYTKIALNIWTLKIQRQIGIFFFGECGKAKYGSTASCAVNQASSAACGQSGTLRIDLRGTGFNMRPDTIWDGVVATPVVTHSDIWDVVDVACYAASNCKGCLPIADKKGNVKMFMEVNEFEPAMETAVVPYCPIDGID